MTEGSDAVFTVTASAAQGSSQTVLYTLSDAPGADFLDDAREGDNNSFLFPRNETSFSLRIPTVGDSTAESSGSITVALRLRSSSNYVLGSPAVATVGVRDNDPGLALSAASVQMLSGGQAGFALTLDTAPTAPVTVTVAVPDDTDLMVDTDPQRAGNQNMLIFTPTNWSTEQRVRVLAGQEAGAVTVTISASGGDYEGLTAAIRVVVLAGSQVDASATAGWQVRFGRTVAQQVVTAVQGRFTTTPQRA